MKCTAWSGHSKDTCVYPTKCLACGNTNHNSMLHDTAVVRVNQATARPVQIQAVANSSEAVLIGGDEVLLQV